MLHALCSAKLLAELVNHTYMLCRVRMIKTAANLDLWMSVKLQRSDQAIQQAH